MSLTPTAASKLCWILPLTVTGIFWIYDVKESMVYQLKARYNQTMIAGLIIFGFFYLLLTSWVLGDETGYGGFAIFFVLPWMFGYYTPPGHGSGTLFGSSSSSSGGGIFSGSSSSSGGSGIFGGSGSSGGSWFTLPVVVFLIILLCLLLCLGCNAYERGGSVTGAWRESWNAPQVSFGDALPSVDMQRGDEGFNMMETGAPSASGGEDFVLEPVSYMNTFSGRGSGMSEANSQASYGGESASLELRPSGSDYWSVGAHGEDFWTPEGKSRTASPPHHKKPASSKAASKGSRDKPASEKRKVMHSPNPKKSTKTGVQETTSGKAKPKAKQPAHQAPKGKPKGKGKPKIITKHPPLKLPVVLPSVNQDNPPGESAGDNDAGEDPNTAPDDDDDGMMPHITEFPSAFERDANPQELNNQALMYSTRRSFQRPTKYSEQFARGSLPNAGVTFTGPPVNEGMGKQSTSLAAEPAQSPNEVEKFMKVPRQYKPIHLRRDTNERKTINAGLKHEADASKRTNKRPTKKVAKQNVDRGTGRMPSRLYTMDSEELPERVPSVEEHLAYNYGASYPNSQFQARISLAPRTQENAGRSQETLVDQHLRSRQEVYVPDEDAEGQNAPEAAAWSTDTYKTGKLPPARRVQGQEESGNTEMPVPKQFYVENGAMPSHTNEDPNDIDNCSCREEIVSQDMQNANGTMQEMPESMTDGRSNSIRMSGRGNFQQNATMEDDQGDMDGAECITDNEWESFDSEGAQYREE